ncbi:ribonuclease E activity regulator RraA [Marihabitans asiaticum]|uniref:4-hydroxy-4-methyl-2-oxoglutarate aldolase n=1 Tax=Marihabitans asiaticum TaxID=415218 RepID=A0A560WG44_9MICO|nr:ribonuclease E activity regulator RraA [Marihabitans asiaticum]TWD16647.1 regulator of ribonuclease activity A [Marihabitans asiaticum]
MPSWTTPDLCDDHPDDVRVLAPGWLDFGGREAFAGPVVTIACFEDNSLVKALVEEDGRGRVVVVDGGGSLRKALLGDQIAEQLAAKGWSGLVISGAVRDVEVLRTLDLGVRALGSVPLRTAKRGLGDRDVPVTITGVRLAPGDHLYADATGIVVADHALT